ncbi:hypothetical protein V6N13_060274 [Hibiscus sabdariffa]|uniref:procollagen-proline 4-dioxygenase n=1 Tax=Hibiscus sabdariffa TaxID=183260 RepID=A0ABR2GBF3_9ROSI
MASLVSNFLLLLLFTFSFSNFSAESRKELKDKEVIQLRHSVQSNVVDPSRVLQLLWRPRSGFFSIVVFCQTRSATILFLWVMENFAQYRFLAMIEERISAWTFLPKENGSPLSVRHYELEEAGQNLTYFGNKSMLAINEPLMATVVLYLSNVTGGGEILFPHAEPKSETWSDCAKTSNFQKPVKGNAVLFFMTHLNGSPDGSSSHARCPVLEGEMWRAIKFFYLRAVAREKTSFDFGRNDECSDEDASCPHWAAIGECHRNPVFMVGSTDYYGTCRKSCNAC